ncbi:hypothetical protein HK405_014995, partial [Cladochytrium tenue]
MDLDATLQRMPSGPRDNRPYSNAQQQQWSQSGTQPRYGGYGNTATPPPQPPPHDHYSYGTEPYYATTTAGGGSSTAYEPERGPAPLSWRDILIPANPWARLALVWSLCQFVVLEVIEAIVLYQHMQEFNQLKTLGQKYSTVDGFDDVVGNDRAITVYIGLFMAAQFFQLYLSFDAITTSSVIQLIATTVFDLAITVYSVIEYVQSARVTSTDFLGTTISTILDGQGFVRHRSAVVEVVAIVASVAFFAGWLFLSAKLYNVFGWSIFKNMGADVNVRYQLYVYHIYMMLLKLDVFFLLGFVAQYISLVVYNTSNEVIYSNIFTQVPLAIVLLLLAYFSVKRESRVLMCILIVGLLGGLGYLVFRLDDIYVISAQRYSSSRTSLTLFIVLTAVLIIATIVVGVMAMMNFGKGLQEA